MKVLFVTHHYLDANSGGSFASRAYINAFAEIADECMLLYPNNGKQITSFIASNVILSGVSNRKSNVGKLIDIYRGRISRYSNVIGNVIADFKPDVVVFDNSRTSVGNIQWVKKSGIKVITIHHNYEMEYYLGSKPNLLWRFPFLYYMKQTERDAVLWSDLNLTLTRQDIVLLQKNYDPEHKTVFECSGIFECRADASDYSNLYLVKKNNGELIFAITGSLAAHQTEISLIPFLENYYPLLLMQFPYSKLIIAGRNPSSKIQAFCKKYENIELIANPKNISNVISQADIYICPISVGGGLKLRVMDGLKLGLPVLAHIVSSRGYDEFGNADLLYSYSNNIEFEKGLKKAVAFISKEVNARATVMTLYGNIFSFERGLERLNKILDKSNIS